MSAEARFIEAPEAELVDRRRKVWLECNAEAYDLRAVKVLHRSLLAREIVLASFICPRCGGEHESLLFN